MDEFSVYGVEVVYLLTNTRLLIQSLFQGITRPLQAHYTQYPMERVISAVDESPNRT